MASSSGRKSPWVLVALAAVVIIGWLAINILGGSSAGPLTPPRSLPRACAAAS
jgi:hypothetical protein